MDNPSLEPRHDWSASEIRAIHDLSLPDLLFRAQSVHRETQPRGEVQLCTLLSIKTGGCPEDCGYCSQSSRYQTPVQAEPMLSLESVVASARRAKETGSTRFCMGAAWRDAKEGPAFERVLSMIREVKALDLEVCATLGMLNETQARKLKEAGLDAYNHNLDTSREHYRSIVSTRTYDARLETLDAVRRAGLEVCCGGILGMGESIDDRCQLLAQLASFTPHPESVPINALVPIEGTPLAELPRVDPLDMVRMIATARLVLPRSRVRLSAGRQELSREAQMLCFVAGANSIFYGDRLLTTGNPDVERDQRLLRDAGMVPMTTPV